MKLKLSNYLLEQDKERKKTNLNLIKKKLPENTNITIAKSRLLKVMHVDNDDLFNDPNDLNRNIGGHFVFPVAYNYKNNDVGVAVITSIEDGTGNQIKQNQVNLGLIYPLEGHITGLKRKSGIKQEVVTKNRYTGININYDMLSATNNVILIDSNIDKELYDFLFENVNHNKKSKANKRRTEGYIKIKK